MLLYFLILGGIILIDQLTKLFIFDTPAKSILGDLLWFQSERNTGAAFSMFSGNNIVFIIIVLLSCIALFYLLFSKKLFTLKIEKIAISLVLAGAISNVIDRIIFNFVRDFIYLKFIDFAVFNIADMAITFGAILMIVAVLFFQKKEEIKND